MTYPDKVISNTEVNKRCLYKHVATIHKANELSLLQNKISNVLYFNAYPELKTKDVYTITIKELCTMINYRGHNYDEIKNALLELIGTTIQWNILKDDKLETENWTASTALASASISKGGVCQYSYSYHMRTLLADPVMYGVINMSYQARFRSKYGLALYENCARFVSIKQTCWFEINFFRRLMGIEEGKYSEFRDFKRRVLDAAIEEVNTYSDIRIESVLERLGIKVSKIKLLIELRNKKEKIMLAGIESKTDRIQHEKKLSSEYLELQSILCKRFSLSSKQADFCLKKYEYTYLKEKMKLTEQAGDHIKSLAAYLISALKNDYKDGKTLDKVKKEELKNITSEYNQIKNEMFVEKLKTKSNENQIIDFFNRFKAYLLVNDKDLHKLFCEKGLIGQQLIHRCYKSYTEKFPDLNIE